MNISESISLCIENAYAVRAPGTARAYGNACNLFVLFLKENGIETTAPLPSIKMDYFIRFSSWIASRGYAKATMKTYLSGIKFYLDYLVIDGILEPTYAETIRYEKSRKNISRKAEYKLPRFPALDDVSKMQEAVRTIKQYGSPIYERNVAVIEFLASTGCRNNELCELKIRDFGNDYRSAFVLGKGNKERQVFLSRVAAEAIEHYWKVRGYRGKKTPAFTRHDAGSSKKILPLTTTSIRNIIKEVQMVAGIEKFSPHYFRHAFAIKLLRDTGNLALTQDLLGHQSPVSTRVYAKIYPDDLRIAHKEVFG